MTDENLRACDDCGKLVSRRATACPHCGGPIPQLPSPQQGMGTGAKILLVAGVALIGILALGSWTPTAPATKVEIWDRSPKSQEQRLWIVQQAQQNGWMTTYSCNKPGPAWVRVTPDFAAIAIEEKQYLATAILRYCFSANDSYGYVVVQDSATGQQVGHQSQDGDYRIE